MSGFVSKGNSFTAHHQNIQSWVIYLEELFEGLFTRRIDNYPLCSERELLIPKVSAILKGKDSPTYFGAIGAKSCNKFGSKIEIWKPEYLCRLCQDCVQNLGFVIATSSKSDIFKTLDVISFTIQLWT